MRRCGPVGVLLAVLGLALAISARHSKLNRFAAATPGSTQPLVTRLRSVEQGARLFAFNCAPCHGEDARGDEGPSLHNLPLNEASIGRRIADGIKGEMPRFGSKLQRGDIEALIAFLHTLRD